MFDDLFKPFDSLPCFTKRNLRLYFPGSEDALNERIKRALKKERLLELKKGLYTTNFYYLREPRKNEFKEFLAAKLRFPSYLSLEYVLNKYSLLTEAAYPFTSITLKTTRRYQNFSGSYLYFNLKRTLYFGFEPVPFYGNEYYMATKAKALFDYLYLKRNLGPDLKKVILEDLRLNWDNFSIDDFELFLDYVRQSDSQKMSKILNIVRLLYA